MAVEDGEYQLVTPVSLGELISIHPEDGREVNAHLECI